MMLRRNACRIAAWLILSGWLCAGIAQETGFSWRVELDTPETVQPLLEQYLDIYRYRGREEVDSALLDRLVARTPPDVRQLLATAGYFSPRVEVTRDASGNRNVVRLKVTPGQQATVSRADIRISGAIAGNPAESARRRKIIEGWKLPVGTAFRQSAWDNAKESLLRELQFDGYPAARIADSEAAVDAETNQVSVSVGVDSGPLFLFGAPEISGLKRYPKSIVENLNRIKPGERYSYDEALKYQTALQASGYFQSASVTVEPDPVNAAAAPLRVNIVEYPAMKVDLGVGYSTDAYFRSEATFTHNSTLRPGWQSLARLRLDSIEQLIEGYLAFLPEASGWRNRIGVEAKRSDIENQITRGTGITARRTWHTPEKELDWSLKYQIEEQSITAGPVDHLEALTLNFSWTRRKVDDLLRPKRGYMLNLQLGGASAELLSTRSFTRSYARGLYIAPFNSANRVHLRSELGAVWADARDGIPSEFLFRTGGDQSVRGYDYQSLGVRQGTAIVGGRFLGTATVEYQHDFTAEWGGALFVDAGNAADSPGKLQPVYGYGAGVRWITPAGSINLDLARAQETGKLRLHFTLGVRF